MYSFSSKLPHHLSVVQKVYMVIYCNLLLMNKQQQQQKNTLSKDKEAKTFHTVPCWTGVLEKLVVSVSKLHYSPPLSPSQALLETQVITFYFCPSKLNLFATYLRSLSSVLTPTAMSSGYPLPTHSICHSHPARNLRSLYLLVLCSLSTLKKIYRRIVALHVSFYYAAKWINYAYTYIPSPSFSNFCL